MTLYPSVHQLHCVGVLLTVLACIHHRSAILRKTVSTDLTSGNVASQISSLAPPDGRTKAQEPIRFHVLIMIHCAITPC